MARFEVPDGWTAQAYRFALDPTPAQVSMLESHCGAARFAFNHMLGVVKANLDQRSAEQELIPAQGWSLAQLRKTWNARKDEGRRGGRPTARRPTTPGWMVWPARWRTGRRPGPGSGPVPRSGSRA